jgi:uncharacterized protein (DUF302 family)
MNRDAIMIFEKSAIGSVEQAARRVEEATKANGFGVIGIINLKEKITSKGVEFEPECIILEVCNPNEAKKVLDADIAISTVLPCRIAVYERDGKTWIATVPPTVLLAVFNQPDLLPVARSVEETMIRIIETAAVPPR